MECTIILTILKVECTILYYSKGWMYDLIL